MSKIDEILEELHNSWIEDDYEFDDPCGLHAKAELLQLVLEVIGNPPIATRGTTQNPTNEKYWTKATTVRQKLIDEQRQKAYELFGVKE